MLLSHPCSQTITLKRLQSTSFLQFLIYFIQIKHYQPMFQLQLKHRLLMNAFGAMVHGCTYVATASWLLPKCDMRRDRMRISTTIAFSMNISDCTWRHSINAHSFHNLHSDPSSSTYNTSPGLFRVMDFFLRTAKNGCYKTKVIYYVRL
jgi:hypothetical protein